MNKKIALALALALAPLAASAEGFSYTYVEGGYQKQHVNEDALNDPEADGGYLRGSFALGDSAYLLAGAGRVSDRSDVLGTRVDVDVNEYEFGVGYHQAMSERVDFIADLSYLRQDAKADAQGIGRIVDESFTGGRVAAGVRGVIAPKLEGLLKASYMDGGDFDGSFGGTAGLEYRFTPMWSLNGEVEVIEDTTRYTVGVRASF